MPAGISKFPVLPTHPIILGKIKTKYAILTLIPSSLQKCFFKSNYRMWSFFLVCYLTFLGVLSFMGLVWVKLYYIIVSFFNVRIYFGLYIL